MDPQQQWQQQRQRAEVGDRGARELASGQEAAISSQLAAQQPLQRETQRRRRKPQPQQQHQPNVPALASDAGTAVISPHRIAARQRNAARAQQQASGGGGDSSDPFAIVQRQQQQHAAAAAALQADAAEDRRLAPLRDLFNRVDCNGSGHVDWAELLQGVATVSTCASGERAWMRDLCCCCCCCCCCCFCAVLRACKKAR